MKTRVGITTVSWIATALMGCSFGMTYESPEPETGTEGSLTVGAAVGGPAVPRDTLDRTQAPEVGAPPDVQLPEIQDYTLDNGLRVVLVERHALPLVSMVLQLRGGASAHSAAQAGLAALTADMLDEGTASRSALEVADAVDVLGATLTSTAGYDVSQLRLSVLAGRFPQALEILADVVMHPTFPEAELQRVKAERTARIIQRRDVPAALADDAFMKVLYGQDHPYGAPLLGTVQSLAALTRDDVVAYHRARYRPGQATLVVAGDVSRERLDSLLADAFAGWSGEGESVPALAAPANVVRRTLYVVDKPGASQSEVRVGRVAVGRRTDAYYPLVVTNTVLGGSFTSRLNTRLREEKGYTYGAGSFLDMRRAPGPFEAAAAVATAVTDSAVADFVAEIDELHEQPVPGPELDRARSYLALRLPQRFESLNDVVRRLSELALHDLPLDFYDGYVSGVEEVSADQVLGAAARYLDTRSMIIVVAGDRASIERPLEALGLGPVVVLDSAATRSTP